MELVIKSDVGGDGWNFRLVRLLLSADALPHLGFFGDARRLRLDPVFVESNLIRGGR